MKGIPTQIEIVHGDTVQNGIPTPENPIIPVSLTGFERKMTNADKIRQMTDEELASILCGQCTCCAYQITDCTEKQYVGCEDGVLEWLKQEVLDDDKQGTLAPND